MAAPEIPIPMYTPLKDYSPNAIVPGLNKIPNNSAGLLKVNDKFIESFMVGVNHAFGGLLLWNQYPTDQRGSCFRQFWDTTKQIAAQISKGTKPHDAQQLFYDIPPINTWITGDIGLHPNIDKSQPPIQPPKPVTQQDNLVFVIRGDLLKRFPNTNIYAVRSTKDNPPAPILNNPDPTVTYHPIFSAFFAPDITCLGFNLITSQVIDNNPGVQGADHGFFFVLEEPPHEPKFGLEPSHITVGPADKTPSAWDNLSWDDVKKFPSPNGYLDCSKLPTFPITDVNPNAADKTFVKPAHWDLTKNNGQTMAAILMRRPFRLCVHAEEMIPT